MFINHYIRITLHCIYYLLNILYYYYIVFNTLSKLFHIMLIASTPYIHLLHIYPPFYIIVILYISPITYSYNIITFIFHHFNICLIYLKFTITSYIILYYIYLRCDVKFWISGPLLLIILQKFPSFLIKLSFFALLNS